MNISQIYKSIRRQVPRTVNKILPKSISTIIPINDIISKHPIIIESNIPDSQVHGVCTCVNFSDYLDITLHYNIDVFDSITVVTSPSDIKTQKVCEKYNVNPVLTDKFFDDDAPFNKGKGINEGLQQMDKSDWVCIFDSDMIFPKFKNILYKLDKGCLYGMKRRDIGANLNKIRFPLTDISDIPLPTHCTWIIGCFQLYHSSYGNMMYSEKFNSAENSDNQFTNAWSKKDRRVFQGLIGFHISTPKENWYGRISPPFLPS